MSGIGPKHVAPFAMPVKCRFCDKTIRKDSMEKHCNTVHKDIVTKECRLQAIIDRLGM